MENFEGESRRPLTRLARGCAVAAAALGLFALLGWIVELPLLAGLEPGTIPMAPGTAMFFGSSG